jgi:hypothetical protein
MMDVGKLHLKSCCLVIVIAVISLGAYPGLAGAAPAGGPDRFERVFGIGDFKVTQDAAKYEIPENGMYKIMPRSKNTAVWTQFPLPESAWRYREWLVTASVNSSEGAGAGVGAWGDEGGYALMLFPDGRGTMRYYEGRKATWSVDFKAANFAFPAKVSLSRDSNGSVIGRVNDVAAAVRLIPVDLKKTVLPMVKSVSFATLSSASSDRSGAVYESLGVQAWGQSQTGKLFDSVSP